MDIWPHNAHLVLLDRLGPEQTEMIDRHFRYRAKGYKFAQSYRRGYWDGYIRFLRAHSARFRSFPKGLLPRLLHFCLEQNIDVGFHLPDIGHERMPGDFVRGLPVTIKGERITPYDYQTDTALHEYNRMRSLILCPTGGGKSLIAYLLIRQFMHQHPGDRIAVIVPKVDLVLQLYGDLCDYSRDDPTFIAESIIARIHGKSDDNLRTGRPIVISTWQSLHKRIESDRRFFDGVRCVIGDESHRFAAKSLVEIMEAMTGAEYRFGLTGTLDSSYSTSHIHYESCFGHITRAYRIDAAGGIDYITTRKLIDETKLAYMRINVIELIDHDYRDMPEPDDPKLRRAMKRQRYRHEIDHIISSAPRNTFIRDLARRQQGNTLVLFRYVEKHGKILLDMFDGGNDVHYVSGKTPGEMRESIRAAMETSTNAILIASQKVFGEGTDIREIHNIIMAMPTKSEIAVLQSIGRGLRKAKHHDTTVYDLGDLFPRSRYNYSNRHMRERLEYTAPSGSCATNTR